MTVDTVVLPREPASSARAEELLAAGYTETPVGGSMVYTRTVDLSEVVGEPVPSEQITGTDVGDLLSLHSVVALAKAGHTTASAVLALTDDELLAVDGVGLATLAKLRALGAGPAQDADTDADVPD